MKVFLYLVILAEIFSLTATLELEILVKITERIVLNFSHFGFLNMQEKNFAGITTTIVVLDALQCLVHRPGGDFQYQAFPYLICNAR